jgi:hypothetical protein
LKLESEAPALGKIDGINMTGIGEAVIPVVDEFIVRVCFPPFKTGHEIDEVTVSKEHGH